MTTTPIQSDMTLWRTLRTRRRRTERHQGLDAAAYRWTSKFKHARLRLPQLRHEAQAVMAMHDRFANLSEAALDQEIAQVQQALARRQTDRDTVRHALATAREIAYREKGQRPYEVQLIGALGLFHGQIVEMATGEGKTLVAAVGATMLGWLRRPVHIITVNDYLSDRDATENGGIFRRAGLTCATVVGQTPEPQRAAAYKAHLVYTTQKELVADYLRDQLKLGKMVEPISTRWLLEGRSEGGSMDHVLVPGLHVAIVDEIDAVLIDEAVTPLIIAQPRGEDAQSQIYLRARDIARSLEKDKHYRVDLLKRQVKLNAQGKQAIVAQLGEDEHAIWRAKRRREELVEQALVAEHCYHAAQHYQIVEDQVMIVDEYSGRFMQDRQWQLGLHQAVEAKHDLEITADRDTVASLSFQRFFQKYPHLCGMTGTAMDAATEMETTYGLPVRVVPTHRPVIRQQWPDQIFVSEELRWHAVVRDVIEQHQRGRAVLVGTRSIEASQTLSELLTEAGIDHEVLNAVHHEQEARIVAKAGESGAVTVATNMAGRGTDIKLGAEVRQAGGLHVILTERHTARRIDRQLFGRSGRQGDPGSARCILSLEDDLLIKFAPGIAQWLRGLFIRRRGPLPAWTVRVFDLAQRRAQAHGQQARLMVVHREQDLDKMLPGQR